MIDRKDFITALIALGITPLVGLEAPVERDLLYDKIDFSGLNHNEKIKILLESAKKEGFMIIPFEDKDGKNYSIFRHVNGEEEAYCPIVEGEDWIEGFKPRLEHVYESYSGLSHDEKMQKFLVAAKDEGFNISPSIDPNNGTKGYYVFKSINGKEVVYSPEIEGDWIEGFKPSYEESIKLNSIKSDN